MTPVMTKIFTPAHQTTSKAYSFAGMGVLVDNNLWAGKKSAGFDLFTQ